MYKSLYYLNPVHDDITSNCDVDEIMEMQLHSNMQDDSELTMIEYTIEDNEHALKRDNESQKERASTSRFSRIDEEQKEESTTSFLNSVEDEADPITIHAIDSKMPAQMKNVDGTVVEEPSQSSSYSLSNVNQLLILTLFITLKTLINITRT